MSMKSRFQAGDRVLLMQEYPDLGLKAGAAGVVWMEYAGEPPAYEVTFRDADGNEFDLTVSATEIAAARSGAAAASEAA
jgi:hypothetical protein